MSEKFIRVSDGDREEIIPVSDLVKVYKSEGSAGQAIVYEFDRLHNGAFPDQWREEYCSTIARDFAFDALVRKLCDMPRPKGIITQLVALKLTK